MSTAEHLTREYFDATVSELKALISSMAKQPEAKDTITALEIRDELGLKTRSGLMQWARAYNLKPISRGVYRLDDYRAAKARAALRNGHNMVRRKSRLALQTAA